ncbi:ribosomal-processing cysteine protease Prp [Levilactobacillus zymae]|uniref:ribosomal-processing cysteine protease Prp n=1 Tax=Levilactobacillus zymae TaxID=267363 RepID=UPI0028B38EF6|nr:ribosomal-processing cysteine protease Prp [Levilactobacillus zymae]MDT6980821.1 ribosomal-processing cysteine protease Prp [Levilactobacillus zymae]
MIHATIHHGSDRINSFQITGHADSGEYGQDIVCAAVSVLAITTVNGLQRVAKIPVTVDNRDQAGGFLEVTLPPKLEAPAELKGQTLLQSFADGLRDVATNYADFVEVNEVSD